MEVNVAYARVGTGSCAAGEGGMPSFGVLDRRPDHQACAGPHGAHARAGPLPRVLTEPPQATCSIFFGKVEEYHAWLVTQAKTYILTQTGFELEGADYLLACRQFEDFHMQQGRFGDWGGAEGGARGRAGSGDAGTIECASWWSKYRVGAAELQRCALRVMHMWSCTFPAERNWAATRASTRRSATGCGYVLPWQRDEGMLDCQAGLEVEPMRTGTRQGMTEAEIAEEVALITHDLIGSSAPPSADVVFERRACVFLSTAGEEVPPQTTVEEEVAATAPQEAVPMDHNADDGTDTDDQLMRRFITEEVDPVMGGFTPGTAIDPGISAHTGETVSEMGTHFNFDLSISAPPTCGWTTSTDRAPSRDDAADETRTQTPRERTQAESPDTARDIME
ncbi:hypothetical protein CBR_g50458 [Chara braunii]|uniref:Uncharacterized protein n=1 Tax=Chara braunii TaxID=69332 RepID=A0A388M6X3_CHABU|nr:hypothetical protein CBR_g50458 [Chara braunii]|eukprot:GBG90280.1 hypothetical protein CBR_g50458 [Chara braunii]